MLALTLFLAVVAATPADRVRDAVSRKTLRCRLSTPEQLEKLLGPPTRSAEARDGGKRSLVLEYPGVLATFSRYAAEAVPHTLRSLVVEDRRLDIGTDDAVLVLRDAADLAVIDSFDGLAGVSLAALDLRSSGELLGRLPFDSRTVWPATARLPRGFEPARLLENGKNPGLGLRGLHSEGIDGRGVGIAIIDQPLLLGHVEYSAALVRYDASGLFAVEPQMHGPPVASIAVGRSTGVAPGAALSYYAFPSWKGDNRYASEILHRIIDSNGSLAPAERVRVVSISTANFPNWKNPELWAKALARAEADGVMVVSCDTRGFEYGAIDRIPGGAPDDVASYRTGRFVVPGDVLRVPAGGRSFASYRGPDAYTYDTVGGMSWAAPYVAGVAVLGYQVNPALRPAQVRALLAATATPTAAGPIVNPRAFVAAAREAAVANANGDR